MKVKLFLVVIVLYACGVQKVPHDDSYDRITITTYDNKYDKNNNLLEIQLITISYIYEKDGIVIKVTDDKCINYYKYINDEEFIIEKKSEVSGNIEIVKYFLKMKESLTLNAQGDTLYYTLQKYNDNSNSELVYVKDINNHYLLDERNNYEEKNEYDEKGNCIKKVLYYFDTNRKEITYLFQGLSYDEAKKRLPYINEDCNIVCYIDKMAGDTLVRQEVINGVIDNIEKTIIEGNEKRKFRFTADMKLTDSFTELEKDGFDIHVHHSVQSNWTDSTYYKKGKEVKKVDISDMSKSIVVSKYDNQGNIVETVEKVKYFNTQNGEELINEMLQVVRENEKKRK